MSLRPKTIVALGLLTGIVGLPLWQLGPKFGFHNRTQVLHELKLQDGSWLLLTQYRNSGFLDPYNVILVRVYTDRHGEAALLDSGSSYRWHARLRKSEDGSSVEIRALGLLECRFVLASNCLVWPDSSNAERHTNPLPQGGWLEELLKHYDM